MKPLAPDPPSLGSLPQVGKVFQGALAEVMSVAGADRAAILFSEAGDEPKLRASVGLDLENFWLTAPLSLSLLRRVQETGAAVDVVDVKSNPNTQNELSLLINDIRSVICTPIWDKSGRVVGMIYVDWIYKFAPSQARVLPQLQSIGLRLEGFLRDLQAGNSHARNPFSAAVTTAEASGSTEASTPPTRPASGSLRSHPASPGEKKTASLPLPSGSLKAPTRPNSGALGGAPGGTASFTEAKGSGSSSAPRVRLRMTAPDRHSQAIFLRSLATMFGAGLPLTRSLWSLAEHDVTPSMRAVTEHIARQVERGQSLSSACHETGAFSDLVSGTLKVGERTGRFHLCLLRLADLEEGSHRRRSRMRAALVYPVLVLSVCVLFLIGAPAAMLSSQVKLLQDLQTEVPWATRLLLEVYHVCARPVALTPLILLIGAALRSRSLRRKGTVTVKNLALRWGPIRKLWGAYLMCQWCQAMAIQVQSGITVADSLTLAAQATSSSQLKQTCVGLHSALVDGEEFWRSLRLSRFPNLVVEMVRVGEESGRLPSMLSWLSGHYEFQFQTDLESLAALFEPLVMVLLGILAAAMMLLTLLPMSRALEHL